MHEEAHAHASIERRDRRSPQDRGLLRTEKGPGVITTAGPSKQVSEFAAGRHERAGLDTAGIPASYGKEY